MLEADLKAEARVRARRLRGGKDSPRLSYMQALTQLAQERGFRSWRALVESLPHAERQPRPELRVVRGSDLDGGDPGVMRVSGFLTRDDLAALIRGHAPRVLNLSGARLDAAARPLLRQVRHLGIELR